MRRQKKHLIMIADSDEDERGLLKAILKLKGFRVVEAVDGRDLICLAQAESPDLFLVNLNLPRVAEAIRRVKNHAHLRHLPLLTVCSKRPSPWQRQLAAQSTRHLTHPIEVNGFCQLIESFLSRPNRSAAA